MINMWPVCSLTSLTSLAHKAYLLFIIWIFLGQEITRISDITERFVYYTVHWVSDENRAKFVKNRD